MRNGQAHLRQILPVPTHQHKHVQHHLPELFPTKSLLPGIPPMTKVISTVLLGCKFSDYHLKSCGMFYPRNPVKTPAAPYSSSPHSISQQDAQMDTCRHIQFFLHASLRLKHWDELVKENLRCSNRYCIFAEGK